MVGMMFMLVLVLLYAVHTLELRLAYQTGLLVAQQRFPVPLSLEVRYMDRIAGTNNRLVIRTLGVILAGTW